MSPFFVAWADFERGRAFARGGNDKSAKLYFREAVTILPLYAHAASHLVAMEGPDAALALLEPFATSNEPGILAARAATLQRACKNHEADAAAAVADARFKELLKTHFSAYADHAATFYLGAGKDVSQALTLARANATTRPNEEALELWLTAAEAAKNKSEACAAAAKINAFTYADAPLRARATAAAKDCP
ncbi:hypothetical protein BH09MYX1_BH09MYX1_44360 [soil metagenome]